MIGIKRINTKTVSTSIKIFLSIIICQYILIKLSIFIINPKRIIILNYIYKNKLWGFFSNLHNYKSNL